MVAAGVTRLAGAVPVHTALQGEGRWCCQRGSGQGAVATESDDSARTHLLGQQAGLLAASSAHLWPFWQQMLLKTAP